MTEQRQQMADIAARVAAEGSHKQEVEIANWKPQEF